MVKTNIQTFTGEVEVLEEFYVGANLVANDVATHILTVHNSDDDAKIKSDFFVGDGGLLSNIATTLSAIVEQGNTTSNVLQFNSGAGSIYKGVGLVTTSNVGIQNTNPGHTLSIGSNVYFDNNASEFASTSTPTMVVKGRINATRFEGDGGLLSNIATNLQAIVDQGNISVNVVRFDSNLDIPGYKGIGFVTSSNVGIQNTNPGFNTLSIGSNLFVNDTIGTSGNVLTVHGNVAVSNLNIGDFSVQAAHGLNHVALVSNGTTQVVQFQHPTTGLVSDSNIHVAGQVIITNATKGLDVTSNIEIGGRLKFDTNVFVDTLRIADVASNLVTYDQATGELTDSGGSFMNKFAMVSEQPPSNIFSNVSNAYNGSYTLTTSNLATYSNTFNAFDGTANAWVSGGVAGGYIGGSNVFHETNFTQLSNTHPTQFGDWLAIEFPYKSRLRHMKLTPLTAAQFPASANIYATNDSVTWTDIGYWKDRNPVTNSNVQTISINTPEDFKKYALVATKAAGNSSNVAIQDWNLFTESISVDGGKGVDKRRAPTKTFVFTVAENASNVNKYFINGVLQSSLQLEQNHTYIFDVSSTTLSGHPLRFSTTATGSEYTTGITNLGVYGYGGTATRTFAVSADSPTTLYYFCTNHAGMGATISISPTAELEVSGRIMSRDLVVTGGTTAQRPTYAPPGTFRYNTTNGFMEAYTAVGWASIAQPPTVTSISPLTTVVIGATELRTIAYQAEILHPTPTASDEFGNQHGLSFSSDGTYLIVGCGGDDPAGASAAGSAQVYIRDGTSWAWQAELLHPTPTASDQFGRAVSISGDGLYAACGVHVDDPGVADSGSVQVYIRDGTSWAWQAELVHPTPAAEDHLGYSVSISSDGTHVISGARYDEGSWVSGSNAGSVQVFVRNGTSWTWQAQILHPTTAADDWFGEACAISGDGVYAIAGSWNDTEGVYSQGSAQIYIRDGTSWTHQAQLFEPVVPATSNKFGFAVAISKDGLYAIVGAYGDDTAVAGDGSAYIFIRAGTGWSYQAKLLHPSPSSDDLFGYSVAISGDGDYAAVGVPRTGYPGSIQVYKRVGAAWTHYYSHLDPDPGDSGSGTDNRLGISVAVSSDGLYIAGGSNTDYVGGGVSGWATGSVHVAYNEITTVEEVDAETQVFTATGTGIVSGSTVQLEGVDGSLYSVVDATAPNAAGTQVTFKLGSRTPVTEFPPSAMTTNTSISGYIATTSYFNEYGWKVFNDVVADVSDYWTMNADSILVGYSTVGYPDSGYLPGLDAPYTQTFDGTSHRGHWVQLQIPTAVILTRAIIGSPAVASAYGVFVILGSNDTTIWTTLHAGSASSLSTDVTTPSTGSTKAFKYFRVVIKSKRAGSSNRFIQLNNIQFFGKTGSWDLTQQPYKVRINSTSGLSGTSTAKIGFPVGWTSPAAGATLLFDTSASTTQTLVGTDGGSGSNRTFSVAPGSNALPSPLVLTGSTGAITGQIAAVATTSVTFRLTDNSTGLFTDRAINIVGSAELYSFTSHTFTNAAADGRFGPTFAQMKTAYNSTTWYNNTSYFNEISGKQGFQLWTIPKTATYTIKAWGATSLILPTRIGRGAWTQGNFNLTKGDKLCIIVGQYDTSLANVGSDAAGGAGASWVLKEDYGGSGATPSSLYLVAGGAGGNSPYYTINETLSHAGGTDDGSGVTQAALVTPPGTAAVTDTDYQSGGGASYGINGAGAGTPGPSGGKNPYNGATGGNYAYNNVSYNNVGGFGGGGGSGAHAGAGGGGYVGGRAAVSYSASPGYGGSTRNNGISGTVTFGQDLIAKAGTPQMGKVIITLN